MFLFCSVTAQAARLRRRVSVSRLLGQSYTMRLIYLSIVISCIPSFAGAGLSSLLEPVTAAEVAPVAPATEAEPEGVPSGNVALPVAPPKQPKVELEPKAKPYFLNETTLLDVLAAKIHERQNLDGELRIALLREWTPLKLKSDDWGVNLLNIPSSDLRSNILVRLEVTEGNKTVGQWQLPIKCELWREALVSRRLVSRGQLLLASNFESKTMDVLRLRAPTAPVDVDLSEYEASQSISSGRPLYWRDLAKKPLIRKGQVVEVVAIDGPLHITMKGVALEKGLLNDFIAVRNLTSRKSIHAQILDDKHVQVHF